MPGFESLSRETLSDQVAERLLRYIVSQGLEPGARLPSEQKLADEFAVSRPVVREALRSLVGQQVIEIVNGKGAIVCALNNRPLGLFFQRALQMEEQSILELMEVRRYVEVPMARLAAERRNEDDLKTLEVLMEKMRERTYSSEEYVALDVDFHVAIARAAHNTILYHIVDSVRTSLAGVIGAVFLRQQSEAARSNIQARSQAMHQAIHEAIVRQDGVEAERAMRAHLTDASEAIGVDNK